MGPGCARNPSRICPPPVHSRRARLRRIRGLLQGLCPREARRAPRVPLRRARGGARRCQGASRVSESLAVGRRVIRFARIGTSGGRVRRRVEKPFRIQHIYVLVALILSPPHLSPRGQSCAAPDRTTIALGLWGSIPLVLNYHSRCESGRQGAQSCILRLLGNLLIISGIPITYAIVKADVASHPAFAPARARRFRRRRKRNWTRLS